MGRDDWNKRQSFVVGPEAGCSSQRQRQPYQMAVKKELRNGCMVSVNDKKISVNFC